MQFAYVASSSSIIIQSQIITNHHKMISKIHQLGIRVQGFQLIISLNLYTIFPSYLIPAPLYSSLLVSFVVFITNFHTQFQNLTLVFANHLLSIMLDINENTYQHTHLRNLHPMLTFIPFDKSSSNANILPLWH